MRKKINKIYQPSIIQHKTNKSNTKVPTLFRIKCLYSTNICCDTFVFYEFLKVFLECNQFQNYQSMPHDPRLYTKLSTEFLMIFTHQDLLQLHHSLFQVKYLFVKHHEIQLPFDKIFRFQNWLKDETVLKILPSLYCSFVNSYCTFIYQQIPNKVEPNASNNLARNPPFLGFFCFFLWYM